MIASADPTSRFQADILSGTDPVQIIHGDVRQKLALIPSDTFHCCVTSPPYWGMRDYGYEGQIGAETEINDYIANSIASY